MASHSLYLCSQYQYSRGARREFTCARLSRLQAGGAYKTGVVTDEASVHVAASNVDKPNILIVPDFGTQFSISAGI